MAKNKQKSDAPSIHCSHTRMEKVDKLVAHPLNPNQHTEQQIELLAKVIRTWGWRLPITVSKRSGFIVAGHGRMQAAKLLGVDEVPVDEQEYATEAEEYAVMVSDNKIAEFSVISLDQISSVLEEHVELKDVLGEDYGLLGFTDLEAQPLLGIEQFGDDALPDDLPNPGFEGEDTAGGKVMLVWYDDEEREYWLKLLGWSGDLPAMMTVTRHEAREAGDA